MSEAIPIWRYVRLDEFVPPGASAKETVRKGLFGLLDKLRSAPPPEEPAIEQDVLQRLPDELLARAAPEPDWTESVTALDAVLGPALAQSAAPAQMVIGAPCSGVARTLARWAETQDLVQVEPPRPEEILNGGSEWLEGLPEDNWVIPRLERCYLRHHHSLSLVRRLANVLSERRRPCVIGCSSWAWAYLVRVLQFDTLAPMPWTLEALTRERLQVWFNRLAHQQGCLFRQSDDGEFVTPPPEPQQDEEPKVSDFLVNLAAHGRGNPGVSWALWRHSLRIAPEDDAPPAETLVTTGEPTLWVKPWSQLRMPALPNSHDRTTLHLLHALLLHGGLPGALLAELLPLSRSESLGLLARLERHNLVAAVGNEWRVTALGYPAVREALRDEGYLVDAL